MYIQQIFVILRMQVSEREQFYQQIGKKIKRERNISGINQEELGRRVGVSRVSIVNIERGKQMPAIHVIWKIANALETTVDRLFPPTGTSSTPITLEKNVKLIGDDIKQDNLERIFNQLHPTPNE